MRLFIKKEQVPPTDDVLASLLEDCQADHEVLIGALQDLIGFLKEFSLEIREIGFQRFQEDLDELATRCASPDGVQTLGDCFKKKQPTIAGFIRKQKHYLEEKEKELRDIIDLLAKAMAILNTENQAFYQRVFAQSEKIEQITGLDDIKKIKSTLAYEIDQIRQMLSAKQEQDALRIEKLANRIDFLQNELDKAKSQSETDGLTGVYNRQAFDAQIVEDVRGRDGRWAPFSLLLLDLDDFKKINDTYGHLTGDRVLVAFAQKCRQSIRSNDFIARYGGEEFAIIMPGASLRNAAKKARQICDSIARTRYALEGGRSDDYLSITTSIGVSTLEKNDTPTGIIDRADKALYKAKNNGKNQVATEK